MDLFYTLPPFGDLTEGFVPRVPVPYQPATDHGAGPTDPTPAVDVYGLAFAQGTVDGVEDRGHPFWTAGDACVDDRMPFTLDVPAKLAGLLVGDFGIGPKFSCLCQVYEMGDPGVDQGLKLGRSLGRLPRAGILPCRKAVRDYPIAIWGRAVRYVGCAHILWRTSLSWHAGVFARAILAYRGASIIRGPVL